MLLSDIPLMLLLIFAQIVMWAVVGLNAYILVCLSRALYDKLRGKR